MTAISGKVSYTSKGPSRMLLKLFPSQDSPIPCQASISGEYQFFLKVPRRLQMGMNRGTNVCRLTATTGVPTHMADSALKSRPLENWARHAAADFTRDMG